MCINVPRVSLSIRSLSICLCVNIILVCHHNYDTDARPATCNFYIDYGETLAGMSYLDNLA